MKWLAAMFLAFVPTVANSDTPVPLVGIWGSEAQCSRTRITPKGTVRASPITVSPAWLTQGGISCHLSWFPVQQRENGLYAVANAICGEDSARTYRVDFLLEGERLTLFWDEKLQNGPMQRCRPER